MIETINIEKIAFEGNTVLLVISGNEYAVDLTTISGKLCNASDFERSIFKISPSGYGIHWPLLDEDLAIGSLIKELKTSMGKG